MVTTTIRFDDALLDQVKQEAGEDISAWVATACRSRLLVEAARRHSDWERAHPEEAAAARRAEATCLMEDEAEREIVRLAEEAAARRDPADTPAAADYEQATRQVRDLLDHICRRFDNPASGTS